MSAPVLYVVNLDRDVERMASLAGNLAERGLGYERVSAVLGREVPDWEKLVDAPLYARRNRKAMALPGEVGCTLSHLKVLETFLRTDAPWCVVLEDDVLVKPEFSEVLEALGRRADDWDLVKLFHFHSGTPLTICPLTASHRLVTHLTRTTSSAAYAINRRGAEALLRTLRPISEQVDHAMDRPWESGIKIRGVSPLPVRLAPVSKKTTIGKHLKFKLTPGRAVRLFCSRTGKEVRRLWHALTEYPRAKREATARQ